MVRIGVGVLGLAILFAACGGGGGAATPQAAFEKFQASIEAKNWGAIYDMASASVIEQVEESKGEDMVAAILGMEPDEVKAMSTKDFFCKMMDKMMEMEPDELENMKGATIKEVKEEGDKATVFFKGTKKDDKMDFVKVEGKWLLADFD